MKVLIDTNILVSALLRPEGTASTAMMRSLDQHEVFISSYTLYELQDVIARKFPAQIERVTRLAAQLRQHGNIVEMTEKAYEEEALVRDPDDRVIYRAARDAGADIILTGDKDLIDLGVNTPQILSPTDFLGMF